MDGEGRLVVTGRTDDVIVTGGENVRASFVEVAIVTVPEVAHAVVVGVDDEEWGQVVVAVVESDHGDVSRIEDAVGDRLARHEIPKRWILVDRLPLLPNGKPDRQAARALATLQYKGR
jgi:O-succinylbenzoic acid--CoA ligase